MLNAYFCAWLQLKSITREAQKFNNNCSPHSKRTEMAKAIIKYGYNIKDTI